MVRFGYSFLSGLLGGQSIIFAKTVIELVKVTMFGKNRLVRNALPTAELLCLPRCHDCGPGSADKYSECGIKAF